MAAKKENKMKQKLKAIALVSMLTPCLAMATTWYVDGTNGSDDNAGNRKDRPKASIQAAIDASSDNDAILVAAGTYSPISTSNKQLEIIGLDGNAVTAIDGRGSSRCADLGSSNGETNTILRGFTIKNGRTSSQIGAGVRCGTLQSCVVTNCVNSFGIWGSEGGGAWGVNAYDCEFICNKSTHGAGMALGRAERCKFIGNNAEDDGGAVHGSTIINCLVANNQSGNWGGAGSGAACAGGTNINCTIVGNCARGGGGIVAGECTLINCAISGNQGTLIYDPNYSTLINCLTNDNPRFVDVANGDYRLSADSPCIDAGDNSYVVGNTDLDGNARIVNGKVDIGCYERLSDVMTYFVNDQTGDDSNVGTSADSPKKTIQSAVDMAREGATISVAPGTYDPFATANKKLFIVSEQGASKTFIDGHENYVRGNQVILTEYRAGDDATNTTVRGFTIQHLVNVEGGIIQNCIVRENNTWSLGGGAVNMAIAENCLIINNRGMNGAAGDKTLFRNCTLVGNTARDLDGVCLSSVLENCIVYGNGNNSRQTWDYYFNRSWLSKLDHREVNVFENDPQFVNAAGGDYRLSADSPCIDAGDNSYVVGNTDLDGNARIVNGKVDIGCYEYGSNSSLMDGLIAWYKFDGDVDDSSAYENLSVAHGGTFVEDRFGNKSSAYHLNGSEWVEVANSLSLSSVTNASTYCAWLKIDQWYSYWIPLACKTDGSDCQYNWMFVKKGYDGHITDVIDGPGGNCDIADGVTFGQWLHIAVTDDGESMSFYLNGTLIETKASGSNYRVSTGNLLLGKDPPGLCEWYYGAMDDVRIYNRAISAQEVSAIYNESEDEPIVHVVTFDANGGTCATDSVKVSDRAAVGELPIAERAGYSFIGWYTSSIGGNQIVAETIVTADMTLYAHWDKNTDQSINPDDSKQVDDPAVMFSPWDYIGVYDGAEHMIAINEMHNEYEGVLGDTDITISFSSKSNGVYTTDVPVFMDVVSTSFWFKVSDVNHAIIHPCKVLITKRSVTLTSGSATRNYNKKPLTCQTVIVGGMGWASGEGATYNVTGTRTLIGISPNTFTYELNEGTKARNYEISTIEGVLIVENPIKVIKIRSEWLPEDCDHNGIALTCDLLTNGVVYVQYELNADNQWCADCEVLSYSGTEEIDYSLVVHESRCVTTEMSTYGLKKLHDVYIGGRVVTRSGYRVLSGMIYAIRDSQTILSENGWNTVRDTPYDSWVATDDKDEGILFWLSNTLKPDLTETILTTSTTPVPVPHKWLERYASAFGGGDMEAAGNAIGKNGRPVWESYVMGLDPNDENSDLKIIISIDKNCRPVVTWTPDLSGAYPVRVYHVYGKESLNDAEWQPVEETVDRKYKFFSVSVELQ